MKALGVGGGGGVDGAGPFATVSSTQSASLRKRIVSFVFDRTWTRKHGRFMVGRGPAATGTATGKGIRLRRAVERTTV